MPILSRNTASTANAVSARAGRLTVATTGAVAATGGACMASRFFNRNQEGAPPGASSTAIGYRPVKHALQ